MKKLAPTVIPDQCYRGDQPLRYWGVDSTDPGDEARSRGDSSDLCCCTLASGAWKFNCELGHLDKADLRNYSVFYVAGFVSMLDLRRARIVT